VLLHVIQLSTELVVALVVDSLGYPALQQCRLTPLRALGVLLSVGGAVMNVGNFVGAESFSQEPPTGGKGGGAGCCSPGI
jgi:hypothetical protein